MKNTSLQLKLPDPLNRHRGLAHASFADREAGATSRMTGKAVSAIEGDQTPAGQSRSESLRATGGE